MILHPDCKPKLRPVEPVPGHEPGTIGVRDPCFAAGGSQVVLSLTEPAFFILALLDGEHSLTDVQREFQQRYKQPLSMDTLTDMVTHLENSLLLEGARFEGHYEDLLREYRAAPNRPMHSAAQLGLDGAAQEMFREILSGASPVTADPLHADIMALIAPHLDYPRGRPCYAGAYAALAGREPPARFVILGTNHFGLGGRSSVVATGQDFATPLGTTATDRAFLERLEARCGDLRRHEYDHLGEHSIELQVCWLQHLFGGESFKMVAFLCPDPCGPTGTAPFDGQGIDLVGFGRSLGQAIAEDEESTIVIASADFSHVGGFFGDQRRLDDEFLAEVRQRDQAVLQRIVQGDAAAFRACVAEDENPTRICSAGCMFTLLTALPDAKATILEYHQAVEQSVQNCVTCAAVVFRR